MLLAKSQAARDHEGAGGGGGGGGGCGREDAEKEYIVTLRHELGALTSQRAHWLEKMKHLQGTVEEASFEDEEEEALEVPVRG